MNASEKIARLRELRAKAMGEYSASAHADLIVASVKALPALLECAAVLEKCEAQFRWYADNHRAKGTPDGDEKAKTNDDMANECHAALQALAEGGAP
jgi:hypothetical protein